MLPIKIKRNPFGPIFLSLKVIDAHFSSFSASSKIVGIIRPKIKAGNNNVWQVLLPKNPAAINGIIVIKEIIILAIKLFPVQLENFTNFFIGFSSHLDPYASSVSINAPKISNIIPVTVSEYSLKKVIVNLVYVNVPRLCEVAD